MNDQLKYHIKAVLEGIRHMDVDTAEMIRAARGEQRVIAAKDARKAKLTTQKEAA